MQLLQALHLINDLQALHLILPLAMLGLFSWRDMLSNPRRQTSRGEAKSIRSEVSIDFPSSAGSVKLNLQVLYYSISSIAFAGLYSLLPHKVFNRFIRFPSLHPSLITVCQELRFIFPLLPVLTMCAASFVDDILPDEEQDGSLYPSEGGDSSTYLRNKVAVLDNCRK